MLRCPPMRARGLLLVLCTGVWGCPPENQETKPPETPPPDKPASKPQTPDGHSTSSTAVQLEELFRMPDPCPEVVATVNGAPLQKSRLESVLRQSQIQWTTTRPDVPLTRFKVLDGAMHQLIERELMHALAKKLGAEVN